MRVDFHPEATAELEAAAEWYSQRSPMAARRFVLAVDEGLEKIGADPERFPLIDSRYRACSLHRFPFQIVFRRDGDRSLVLAVAHAKRRPRYWRNRK